MRAAELIGEDDEAWTLETWFGSGWFVGVSGNVGLFGFICYDYTVIAVYRLTGTKDKKS